MGISVAEFEPSENDSATQSIMDSLVLDCLMTCLCVYENRVESPYREFLGAMCGRDT